MLSSVCDTIPPFLDPRGLSPLSSRNSLNFDKIVDLFQRVRTWGGSNASMGRHCIAQQRGCRGRTFLGRHLPKVVTGTQSLGEFLHEYDLFSTVSETNDLTFGNICLVCPKSPLDKYCVDRVLATRRPSRTVDCGPIKFGSDHPIVRQTMATTDTSDVKATIEQVIRCADEGFDLVRITVQVERAALSSLSSALTVCSSSRV